MTEIWELVLKKITYLIVVTLSCAALPAFAQMPDAPPPSDSKMDPRVEKRVQELKQLGYDKKKDPEAQEGASSNNASTNNASADTNTPRPKMGMLRRGREDGLRPESAKRLASFATASRRGREMKKHYMRLAKLERLEALAAQNNNTVLSRRVSDMRDRENRRHQGILKKIAELQAQRSRPPANVKVKIDGEPAQP